MVDDVRIVDDSERAMPVLIVVFLILLGLGYGIGWKVSGGAANGGLIGLGLMFVGCMFLDFFREVAMMFITFFALIGAFGAFCAILWWIFT